MRMLHHFVISMCLLVALAAPVHANWLTSGSGTDHGPDYAGAAAEQLFNVYGLPPTFYGPMDYNVWGEPSLFAACNNVGHPSVYCGYGNNSCPSFSGYRLVMWGCHLNTPAYQGPCDCSKNTGQQQDQMGKPVDVRSGNLFESATDFETSGQDRLGFHRYYNSNLNYLYAKGSYTSRLGIAWRSDYDASFTNRGTSEANVVLPDGAPYHFMNESGVWVPDYWITSFGGEWSGTPRQDTKVTLVTSGTNWVFTDPNDVKYTFDSSGVLTSIAYRDGYTLTLAYTSGHNTSVTDTFGRQLTFTYSGDVLDTMTDPDGNVYQYAYSTKPLGPALTSVTYPDSTPSPSDNPVITYLYEDTSTPINAMALTGIIDENNHRYATWSFDSQGRVLSEDLAGGADHLGFSYDDVNNKRTVTNGLGKQLTYSLGGVEGRY